MIMVFTGIVWRRWVASGRAIPRITNIHLPNPYAAEIEFEDGRKFTFPAEFLRVQSPAADSKRGKAKVVSGRKHVGIMSVDFVGNYGIKLSSGHLAMWKIKTFSLRLKDYGQYAFYKKYEWSNDYDHINRFRTDSNWSEEKSRWEEGTVAMP